MCTGITWNLTTPVNTDRMHKNDNEAWFDYVKQFLRLKEIEIDRRWVGYLKPIFISETLSDIHEVPANSVANKDNVQYRSIKSAWKKFDAGTK
jgi:hypothetical protein